VLKLREEKAFEKNYISKEKCRIGLATQGWQAYPTYKLISELRNTNHPWEIMR